MQSLETAVNRSSRLRFVYLWPDAVVDYKYADWSAVLLGCLLEEMGYGIFVPDVCLQSNDVLEVGKLSFLRVVVGSDSSS